jgi:hypothetical protein
MTTRSKLDHAIALLRHEFAALEKGTPRRELRAAIEADLPVSLGTRECIENAYRALREVDREIWQYAFMEYQLPVAEVSPENVAFFRTEFREVADLIRNAHHYEEGFGDFAPILSGVETKERHGSVHAAMSAAVSRWFPDEGDSDELTQRGIDLERARDLIDESWFKPDEWLDHRSSMSPILLNYSTYKLPGHLRYVIGEAYQAFGFGLWGGAIILSRAVVEAAIQANAQRLGIALQKLVGGKKVSRELKELINDCDRLFPGIGKRLHAIREIANSTIHASTTPRSDKSLGELTALRKAKAAECLAELPTLVETLFGCSATAPIK